MRQRARTDDNQAEIVQALRAAGCTVAITSGMGAGFPDLACGRAGINYFLEVKDGRKVKSDRRLTPQESAWHEQWRGQVAIVESVEQALEAVGL